jgi:DNA-binding NtrC family response regulator
MVDPVEAPVEDSVDARPVVLVVEDEFSLRWPTSEYLRDSGYRVVEAASVDEAVMVFASHTRVDVVFSDINLKGDRSGIALSKWLHEHHPCVPMLMTSGHEPAAQSVSTGEKRLFIAKPYVLAEVDQLIRSVLPRNG